jgi:glycosyltransferase involved in cell wall biosynthesis
MNTVSIILSTYNGEKYIIEQLKSLATQSYVNTKVYIHDDGSTDKTVELIKNFIRFNTSKIQFILLDDEKKLKYPECFIKTLVNIPKSEYYAFCDQDDIWYPDKIERGVNSLKGFNKPALYFTAVDYVDENLTFIRRSRFAKYATNVEKYGLQEFIFGGEPMGMTFLFNHKVKEAIDKSYFMGKRNFKDGYIKLYAAACGKIIYDKKPSAQYRRHPQAVTNTINPSTIVKRYLGEIKHLLTQDASYQREILCFLIDNYSDQMSIQNQKLIILFSKPGHRLKKILWPKRFRVVFWDEVFYRLLFFLNKA